MIFSPKFVWTPILAATLAALLPTHVVAQNAQVRHIGVANSGGITEIKIDTNKRLMPFTQVLTDPDRLVIDFPDALPAPELHAVAVNHGAVKGVRASLLSAKPAMTRVVIDLKSAQEFRLVPSNSSVTIKFMGNAPAEETASAEPKSEPKTVTVATPEPAPEVAKAAPPVPATPVAAPPSPVPSAPVAVKEASPMPVLTTRRPTITIERASSTTPRPSLSPATVVRPAIEAPAPPPAPVSAAPAPAPPVSGTAQIRRVALLKSGGAMEIEIETSQRVVPATQLIAGPDRLVLDFPGSFPGPQLRAMSVNKGEVKGVRAALLSSNPPVTRVVLDLKSPQEFQVFPSSKSVVVKLPGSVVASAAVPANVPQSDVAPAPPPEPTKKVTVIFQDGKLRLSSEKGSLADVLNEVRAQTGADIAIPAGAEQEQVVATLGPATPREVLSQLLNGSRYNFIIVGTDADANQVERVVLSPKGNLDITQGAPPASEPEPEPVAENAPARSVRSVRANAVPPPPPTQVPQADDGQPQGDSNPPPDTTPQPGDPQPAPN